MKVLNFEIMIERRQLDEESLLGSAQELSDYLAAHHRTVETDYCNRASRFGRKILEMVCPELIIASSLTAESSGQVVGLTAGIESQLSAS